MTAASPAEGGVAALYAERLDATRSAADRYARRDRWISHSRLAVFGAGVGLAWLSFGLAWLAGGWLLVPTLVFAGLLVAHESVIRERDRLSRAIGYYEEGLHRLDGSWIGRGTQGGPYREPSHLYADDLDCFGAGSVFERLCTARTAAGEDVLAAWFAAPAAPAVARERQIAVAELRDRLALREELALSGQIARAGLRSEALREWGEAPPHLSRGGLRALAFLLPAASVSLLVAPFAVPIGFVPFGLAVLVQSLFAWAIGDRVRAAVHGVDAPSRDLGLATTLLEPVERAALEAPLLRALKDGLGAEGDPPSRRIARLRRLIELLDARRNQLFAPIAALLLWSTHLGFAIDAWRAHSGRKLAGWIETLGEVEALAALATFAFEEGDAVFPELVDDAPGVLFEAESLGHPLLPADRRVSNDVTLDAEHRIWIVSGSNMSGKSTLLRSVGVNAVLALAGAPVCARRLRIGFLRVGASIQLHDSLLEGRSRFYAEIERLRDITGAAESAPLLFLLDEVLHGTNSHDRAIGAEAVVRGLLSRGAAGLVTTHDLALTRLAAKLPGARNVHFVDQFEAGALQFDYRLREGVLERGNALALMRSVGLDVDGFSS